MKDITPHVDSINWNGDTPAHPIVSAIKSVIVTTLARLPVRLQDPAARVVRLTCRSFSRA